MKIFVFDDHADHLDWQVNALRRALSPDVEIESTKDIQKATQLVKSETYALLVLDVCARGNEPSAAIYKACNPHNQCSAPIIFTSYNFRPSDACYTAILPEEDKRIRYVFMATVKDEAVKVNLGFKPRAYPIAVANVARSMLAGRGKTLKNVVAEAQHREAHKRGTAFDPVDGPYEGLDTPAAIVDLALWHMLQAEARYPFGHDKQGVHKPKAEFLGLMEYGGRRRLRSEDGLRDLIRVVELFGTPEDLARIPESFKRLRKPSA